MTNKLPNSTTAYVEEKKVVEYLLNLSHPDGKSKAKFFSAFGFSVGAWQVMGNALTAQGRNNTVTKVTSTQWGTRYEVDCHCPTPDGQDPCIRSVWEIRLDDSRPRLLTAHPLDKR